MMQVIVVDKYDSEIGHKDIAKLHYEDMYRVAVVWITDIRTGDVLITQRNWSKHNDPGKWMAGASGTVEKGETYESNIEKETEEELGLKGIVFTKGPKVFIDDGKHQFFAQWFRGSINKDTEKIVIQKEEVETYRWVALDELKADVLNNPDKYVPSMADDMRALKIL